MWAATIEARAPSDAEPAERGLDPTGRLLGTLVGAENRKAEQAPQEYAFVESRTLVFVAQDGVAALSPQLSSDGKNRRSEVGAHRRNDRRCHLVALLRTSDLSMGPWAGEEADRGARGFVDEPLDHIRARRGEAHDDTDAGELQRLHVVEEPTAGQLSTECVERDTDLLQPVLDPVPPAEERKGARSLRLVG